MEQEEVSEENSEEVGKRGMGMRNRSKERKVGTEEEVRTDGERNGK